MKKRIARKSTAKNDDFLADVARKIGATLGAVAARTADFSGSTPRSKARKTSPTRRRRTRKTSKV